MRFLAQLEMTMISKVLVVEGVGGGGAAAYPLPPPQAAKCLSF